MNPDTVEGGASPAPDPPPSVRNQQPGSPAADARTEVGRAPADGAVPEAGQIGPYRVLAVLGEGGMGTVYRAEQLEPVRREVALKVVKAGMHTRDVLARFEVERRALAAMSHTAIARVLDAGATADGRPYFVMELVPGMPLTAYADRHRLSLRDRIELFRHVCAGLQHAHQKGVIHRDLKPGNILVAEEDGRPVPKILDFGLAKATTEDLLGPAPRTLQHALLGTPEYMAPEQAFAADAVVDTRADIYSMGVVLYELLTGELPFSPAALRGAGWEGLCRTLRSVEPAKPSSRVTAAVAAAAADRRATPPALARALRGDLDWIVLKALAKEPELRYASAAELALDLQRYLEHEPVLAGPPSTVYRLRKLLRRYRAPVLMAAGLVLALLAGLIGTTLFMLEAERQRVRAAESAAAAGRSAAAATEARAATHVRAARLCYERGAWRQLFDECAAARAAGYGDEAELRILELYGIWGAQRVMEQEGQLLIDALGRLAAIDAGPHRGEALLLRGALGHNRMVNPKAGLQFVRQALDSGTLSEAQALTARSLLTPSLAESMALLRRAVAIDPHCRLANTMLVGLTLFGSDDEERRRIRERFRALYPEDATASLVDFCSEALYGDEQAAGRLAESLRDELPELELFLPLCAHIRRELGVGDVPAAMPTNPFDWQGLLLIVQLMQRLDHEGKAMSLTESPIAGYSSVWRGIKQFLGLAGLRVRAAFQSEEEQARSLLAFGEESAALAPWGVYLTIQGLARIMLQDYAAAEPLLERALVAPSFMRIGAWRGRQALLTCHRRWLRSLAPDAAEFAALQHRFRRNLVAMLQLPGLRAEDFRQLADAAIEDAKDVAAAELVVAAWRENHPEDVGADRYEVRTALRWGAPARALSAADCGLARHASDPVLLELRQAAIGGIGRVGVGSAAVPLQEYLQRQGSR